jgi:dihydroorotase
VIGLETAFAVCYEHLVRAKVINLRRLVDLLSCGPARIFDLPGGTLRPGSLGDVTIVDIDSRYQVTNTFRSTSSNSPFIGATLHGRAVTTIVNGVVRYDIRSATRASGSPARPRPAAPRKKKRRRR